MIMSMIDSVSTSDFYIIGDHFLFFLLIAVHMCLLVDLSPIQKYPTCKLNYLIASITAAVVPSLSVRFFTFSSAITELGFGISFVLILSIIMTLTIQRVIDVEIDF